MGEMTWDLFRQQVELCGMCPLYQGILHKVPGRGDIHSPLMLIGEGPGQQEDEQGLPFVGAAGQLLTRMLWAIRLPRDRVYICNAVKCRPPHNRTPLPEETNACKLHLRNQFSLLKPRVVLLMGATAAKTVLGDEIRVTRDRGQWIERKGVWFLITYHPSALLRDESKKKDAWADLQKLRDKLMELHLYDDIYREGFSE